MRIGTCIQFDDAEHIAKKFETLRNSGFDCCQLVSWKPALWTTENAAEIRRHAEENGVTLSAFWCGWEGACTWNFYEGPQTIGLVPPAFRALRVRNLCDGSDFAAALGVSDVVTIWGLFRRILATRNMRASATLCALSRCTAGKTDSICFLRQGRKHP